MNKKASTPPRSGAPCPEGISKQKPGSGSLRREQDQLGAGSAQHAGSGAVGSWQEGTGTVEGLAAKGRGGGRGGLGASGGLLNGGTWAQSPCWMGEQRAQSPHEQPGSSDHGKAGNFSREGV